MGHPATQVSARRRFITEEGYSFSEVPFPCLNTRSVRRECLPRRRAALLPFARNHLQSDAALVKALHAPRSVAFHSKRSTPELAHQPPEPAAAAMCLSPCSRGATYGRPEFTATKTSPIAKEIEI